jgi:glycosyltransferase involved in cell wall biosynthesis
MQPLVSICCITYNQAKYIRDAIEGFLMQKTTFPFEILIHDDASSDGTDRIIKEFELMYPNLIFPIYQSENQYSKGVRRILATFVFHKCRGKYISICEGDDYWIDPFKLQKQVDFMEKNEEYSFCFHNAENYYCDTGLSSHFNLKLKTGTYITKDLLLKWIIPTASLFFRKQSLPNPIPDWYYSVITGDIALELLLSKEGCFFYMDEIMCVYRRNSINSLSLNLPDLVLYQEKLLYLYSCFFKNYKGNSFIAFYILARARYDLFKVKTYARHPILEGLKNKIFNKK